MNAPTTDCPNCGTETKHEHRFCPDCGTTLTADATPVDSLIGRTLNGKYRVVDRIGAGSMGVVYEAEHVALKKRIALKVLHGNLHLSPETLRRFRQEGIAAGRFSHQNAIQIFDFDEVDGGIFFLAMEYVDGINLKKYLEDHGAVPVPTAVECAIQILGTLAEAHGQGIVHRDLKPENVMLVKDATGSHSVKVLDFGISKLIDIQREDVLKTHTGQILGTPLYMSPEQCLGHDVDARSDLYSTGLILFEMLSGKPPFDGENLTEILLKHTGETPPALRDVVPNQPMPRDLERILYKVLQKKREDRYQSAAEMIEALKDVDFDKLATRVISLRTLLHVGPRAQMLPPRRWMIGAVLLVAAAFVALLMRPSGDAEPGGIGGTGGEKRGDPPARVSLIPRADLTDAQVRYVDFLSEARRRLWDRGTDQAMLAVESALSLSCRDAEAFVVRGWLYLDRGDYDTAQGDFQEALSLSAQDGEAVSGLGWTAWRRGNVEEAESLFDQALELDSKLAMAWTGKGRIAKREGDDDKAFEYWTRAVEADGNAPWALLALGEENLTRGYYEDAQELLVRAKRTSRMWEVLYRLAQVYEAQHMVEAADNQYREAVFAAPRQPEPRLGLAALLVELNRYADASTQLDAVDQQNPGAHHTDLLRGLIALNQEDPEAAKTHFTAAVQANRDDAQAHLLLGILHQRAGETEEALGAYRRAIELEDSALAHHNTGLILFAQQDYEGAEQEWRSALERDGKKPETHLHLGVLYMEYLESTRKALRHFNRYLELGGANPQVKEWMRLLE